MQLAKITIKNYRSIDETLELDFKRVDRSCYFLFGINETGKSNILKACALLSEDHRNKYNWHKDCFKGKKRNPDITEVDYYFDFLPEELRELESVLSPSLPKEIISQICGVRYWIEGDSDSKTYNGFKILFKDEAKIDGYFKKEKEGEASPSEKVEGVEQEKQKIILKGADIIEAEKNQYKEILSSEMEDVVAALIDDEFIENKLPKVISWDSNSKYLINGTIDLNKFKESPAEISIPLFNMFKFLKLDKDSLKKEISDVLADGTDRHKLASDLSQVATKHLNTVWREHEVEVNVTIESNGACDVHFADKDAKTNFFEMQDRSDGFQRFISFILTLSAENLNEELKNSLILLDEPEMHLHPSGIEYLRDELLNIVRNNNYILAASHSIFLVDKKCLERHLTVKKTSGCTHVSYINSDNPFQEEVVFRALNTSIYELVQPFNIVFEGSIDSDIFLATKHKFRTELAGLSNIGGIGATGATEVKKYEKFFRGNLLVKAIAIFDSDSEGRRELDKIKKDSLFDGGAFELKEIYNFNKKDFELEDLLPKGIVLENAKELYKYDFSGEIDDAKPILEEIKRIKNQHDIDDDKRLEKLTKKIAMAVLRDTDPKVLSKDKFKEKYDTYYKFLEALQAKIG